MAQHVRQVPLPPEMRALSTLPQIDYSDVFLAETDRAQDFTAEEWLRKILESAPAKFKVAAPTTWFSLGLKHGLPWSDRTILGWPVRQRDPNFIRVGAESRTGMPAELLLKRNADSIILATLIQHRSPVMKRVWSAVAPHHRRVVPQLLWRGVRVP